LNVRWLAVPLLLVACSRVTLPANDTALARRVCTSEGMWCQDAEHSRCCKGLKCVDSTCVKRGADKNDKEQL
jgi:hypothetical protein